ncbi:hypothetical protein CHARACLAT_032369 [Characodon lateralis]|uniref:Uncharacterized protein n=1 Tax=Characodon lateralis TaxID=208331 RepID=A0ABU7D5P3_9TELE|nr:hypothetical protein [Characodon lateralis]
MKKCLIQIFGFLILDLGMAVSPVHHGDGLLESQPERKTMWFLYNQGFSVLIQSVEGLFNDSISVTNCRDNAVFWDVSCKLYPLKNKVYALQNILLFNSQGMG